MTVPSLSLYRLIAVLLLVLGCAVIYSGVGAFDFVTFDDEHCISYNPHLGPLTSDRALWAFTDTSYSRRYMPLGWLGFSAVFSWSGLDPGAYHRAGALLHAVNALLLFFILLRVADVVMGKRSESEREWRGVAAFLGAAFWAWHPLRVESVAWSAGLLYGQAQFLLLLSMALMLRRPASRIARCGAVGCYGASLLTYPLAIGFVPVFALLAYWSGGGWKAAGRAILPLAVLSVAALAINLQLRIDVSETFRPAPTWAEFPLLNRVMQACYLWIYYLWKPLWPVELTLLNPVLIEFNPGAGRFVGSAVGLVLGAMVAVFWTAARRTWGVFLILHLAVLVPMLGLAEVPHFPSDRYAGFSQLIMAGALVLGLARLASPKLRVLVAVGGLAAAGVLAVLSVKQTLVWRDAQTLFDHIGRFLRPEQSPLMCFERPAVLLFRNGDTAGALALFDRGISRLPGEVALVAGREALLRQAAEHRARLVAIGAPPSTPPMALLQQSLGLAAARAGDARTALAHLQRARKSAPDFYEPAYNLALVWLQLGNTRAALGCFLWAEIHGGSHLSAPARQLLLRLIADQFAAAGNPRLAEAARRRAVTPAVAPRSVQ